LARDAASRLPDGIGTRSDILELIKHSAWMKVDGIDMNNLNNIVSGALDRLHYEPDPCVKYDSERKLWIYLHKDRALDHLEWVVPREPG
jgi:nuclear factor related to kappa-B-binding protein